MARRIWFDADDDNGKRISETYAFPLPKSISCQGTGVARFEAWVGSKFGCETAAHVNGARKKA